MWIMPSSGIEKPSDQTVLCFLRSTNFPFQFHLCNYFLMSYKFMHYQIRYDRITVTEESGIKLDEALSIF